MTAEEVSLDSPNGGVDLSQASPAVAQSDRRATLAWHEICFEVGLLRLDLDIAEASMLELETRATTAEGRAEGAWERLMAIAGRSS